MENITLVQNTVHVKSGKTFKNYLEAKHSPLENGWDIENGKVIFWFSSTVKRSENPISSVSKYVWEVNEEKITPLNNRAIEMAVKN